MKNTLLCILALLLAPYFQSHAQLNALHGEFPLPAGPISGAVNSGASTLQLISDPTLGGLQYNFYTHCWDEGSQYGVSNGGLAWRVTKSNGTLYNEGVIPMVGYDIDIANYVGPDGKIRVLAAYFRATSGGYAGGYYYDIYRFEGGTLIPEILTVMFAPASWYCRGINVDANIEGMGLAITWGREDSVFVKAAYNNAVFGSRVYIGTLPGYVGPDVSIGSYGTTRNLYLTAVKNDSIRVVSLPFNAVVGGGGTITPEGSYTAPSGYELYSVPRIDCPDRFTHKKWSVVFGELDHTISGAVIENVKALVMNAGTFTSAFPITVHSYGTAPVYNYMSAQPVLAYFNNSDSIQVGWMSRHNSVASGSIGNNGRYLTQTVADKSGTFPSAVAGTYYYIDSVIANSATTLSFSGQNLSSNRTGIYAAFSQRPSATVTRMMYKSKSWNSIAFRPADNGDNGQAPGSRIGNTSEVSVFPNPFQDFLEVRLPAAGPFVITLHSIDGRSIYRREGSFTAGESIKVPAKELPSGFYLLHVTSDALGIDHKTKVVK